MKIQLNDYHPHKIVLALAKTLDIQADVDCLELAIDLPSKYGEGRISGFNFSDGIGLVLWTGMLEEDWTLSFSKTKTPPPLIFKFSIEGGIFHQLQDDAIAYQLNSMQGSITANITGKEELFRLPANRTITYVMVLMDREKYLNKVDCYVDGLPQKLQNVINDVAAKQLFFYEGNYSVGVSSSVQAIQKDKNIDIVRALFIEGKSLDLLSKLIKQYRDDLEPSVNQSLLRKYDLDKILSAKEILLHQLQSPPTITDLSKEIGINQTKLKKGFKKVFDKTIRQYIIDERLELAKLLILKQDDSIQEIAAQVGYINTSHFSRLFKRKYGVLPKDFSQNIRTKFDQLTKI